MQPAINNIARGLLLAASIAWCATPATLSAEPLRECAQEELLGTVPDKAQTDAHRQFEVPVVRYPADPEGGYGNFWLQLLVEPSGAVSCYFAHDMVWSRQVLASEELDALASMASWRYQPFIVDGRAATVVVEEYINGEELLERHIPTPDVPLEQVSIRLERLRCHRSVCPSYAVQLSGDGQAQYVGDNQVDVTGDYRYTVPTAAVASLVASVREKNLWSLRSEYDGGWSHQIGSRITLSFGSETKVIYEVGSPWDLPAVVREFHDEVDQTARSAMWIDLAPEAVDLMVENGFDFSTSEGAKLLYRATANRAATQASVLRLLELGARPAAQPEPRRRHRRELSLVETALRGRKLALLDPFIALGELETDGTPDQRKIDAAFGAAVAGGLLAGVERIWAIAGSQPHPSLTYIEQLAGPDSSPKTTSVSLLLADAYDSERGWQGLEIAQWLASRGCDLAGRNWQGRTLLHEAAEANDLDFVRYLLALGLNPNAASEGSYTPLDETTDERVALALLEAGVDSPERRTGSDKVRDLALRNHWKQVIVWLDERSL